jgi:hypothetical protein
MKLVIGQVTARRKTLYGTNNEHFAELARLKTVCREKRKGEAKTKAFP